MDTNKKTDNKDNSISKIIPVFPEKCKWDSWVAKDENVDELFNT
tara:strand:- start:188 stop:319 length:132 start_codon:yes stop_codon:yes gene_type:complete